MKSPLTDKTLSIPHAVYSDDKFRDVRKKAKLDEIDRHKKFHRDKNKTVKVPKFKIGEEVVAAHGFHKRHYCLVEVIDFEGRRDDFSYYGILKRTTDPERVERIGRLIKFEEKTWWSSDYSAANVENKGIKWLVA